MIIKNLIPSETLPCYSYYKKFFISGHASEANLSSPLFYDIETTGSRRDKAQIYLIGMIWEEHEHWKGLQLLCDKPEEEPELLRRFCLQLKKHTVSVQYYGNRFDQPFLEERLQFHGIPSPFVARPSMDLYEILLPYKKGLSLSNFKQSTLEHLLAIPSRHHPDGRKCMQIYQAALLSPKGAYTDALLGHNEEDLLGMIHLLKLLPLLQLSTPSFSVTEIRFEGDWLEFGLSLQDSLPVKYCTQSPLFSFSAEKSAGLFKIPAVSGEIRNYYKNYKDYDYLPEEDTAIPCSISGTFPRSQKKKATPTTCYTWISLTREFLQDFSLLDQYVNHNLPILIHLP